MKRLINKTRNLLNLPSAMLISAAVHGGLLIATGIPTLLDVEPRGPGAGEAVEITGEHFTPDTQSSSPAGYGATSGAELGVMAFRKSTIATVTPCAAMIFPQAR